MKECEICGKKTLFKRRLVNICFPNGTVELIHIKCGIRMKLLQKGFKLPKNKKLENWFEITKKNVNRSEIEYGK